MRRALVVVLAALALGYLVREPLLEAMGQYLVDAGEPAAADAIVVLAGSVPDRILEAVALYKEGVASRIINSRGQAPSGFRQLQSMGVKIPQSHELNRSVAEQLGVPGDAITDIGGSEGSTYDEALTILRYARDQGYRVVLLVTSKYHSRRAALIYRHLAGPDIRIISCPSRYDNFQAQRWWHNRTFRRRVIIEYQKLLAFELLDRWRIEPMTARGAQRSAVSRSPSALMRRWSLKPTVES